MFVADYYKTLLLAMDV